LCNKITDWIATNLINRQRVGAALLLHGGGPTQVINASLAGVVEECRLHSKISTLYGARFGIEGALAGDFIDLGSQDPARIAAVARTPGSALGSSRAKVDAAGYAHLLDVLRKRDIRYLFFNGGNGSMYMAHQIAGLAGDSLRVIGIPKTIDNDIAGTDHSPGYGSTAFFFACAVRDIGEDIRALPGRVSVVEIMGRNAGWLTAATAFARHNPGDPPHLIYLPERPLSRAKFLRDVERVLKTNGTAVVAICEGQTDENGRPIGDLGTPDGFDRRLSGNLAHTLSRCLIEELGMNARSEKPGLLGRSSRAFVSETDWSEAYRCGQAAVQAATAGATDQMIALIREPGPDYQVTTGLTPLAEAAGVERGFPPEWITPDGTNVTPEFLSWAAPLLGPVERHARLAGFRP
jgi:ATP-dependent phosphofructokinase / diphosphate-dependent phosphofructokinase